MDFRPSNFRTKIYVSVLGIETVWRSKRKTVQTGEKVVTMTIFEEKVMFSGQGNFRKWLLDFKFTQITTDVVSRPQIDWNSWRNENSTLCDHSKWRKKSAFIIPPKQKATTTTTTTTTTAPHFRNRPPFWKSADLPWNLILDHLSFALKSDRFKDYSPQIQQLHKICFIVEKAFESPGEYIQSKLFFYKFTKKNENWCRYKLDALPSYSAGKCKLAFWACYPSQKRGR